MSKSISVRTAVIGLAVVVVAVAVAIVLVERSIRSTLSSTPAVAFTTVLLRSFAFLPIHDRVERHQRAPSPNVLNWKKP